MTSEKGQSRGYRTLIFVFVIATLVAPFAWAFARDYVFIVQQPDKNAQNEAMRQVAKQIDLELSRADVGQDVRFAISFSVRPCAYFDPESLQVKGTFPARDYAGIAEADRAKPEIVDMVANGLANHFSMNEARVQNIVNAYAPHELASLHACITSTPLARYCSKRINSAIAAGNVTDEHGLLIRGLLRHVINRDGDEELCSTIPVARGIGQ